MDESYTTDEYYHRVNDYDLQHQSFAEEDLPFWRELVMRYTPAHVLELACGTGRIGIDLLHCPGHFTLEGLDREPAMLASYQGKLEREPEEIQHRVTLHQADMCNYSLPNKGTFDLVLLLFNSIGHLHEITQQLAAFHTTYEHLAPGGRFVVDIYLPDIRFLNLALNGSAYDKQEFKDPNGDFTMDIYRRFVYNDYEQNEEHIYIHKKTYKAGNSEKNISRIKLHVFFPRELQMLFLGSGFRIEAIYGGYDWKPFGQGPRQIVVGRKQ